MKPEHAETRNWSSYSKMRKVHSRLSTHQALMKYKVFKYFPLDYTIQKMDLEIIELYIYVLKNRGENWETEMHSVSIPPARGERRA